MGEFKWSHPLNFDSQIVFQGVEITGIKAAMHAEPFHQQWFVLVTHDKNPQKVEK